MKLCACTLTGGLLFLSATGFSGYALEAEEGKPSGEILRLTHVVASNPKGDGPDGMGNTADDTWQFWLELLHAPEYRRLNLHSSKAPKGIRGKVRGPIGSMTPNPCHTQGWVYHRDWDGRFEGVWGDAKAKQVLIHPYNEKNNGGKVAITCSAPKDATYAISGKLTDLNVAAGHPSLTGITYRVEVCVEGEKGEGKAERRLASGKAGDDIGPASVSFKITGVDLKKGQKVRLVIDPNGSWGGDMTRIDEFTLTPDR